MKNCKICRWITYKVTCNQQLDSGYTQPFVSSNEERYYKITTPRYMRKNVPALLEFLHIIFWTYLKLKSSQKLLQFTPNLCHQYILHNWGFFSPLSLPLQLFPFQKTFSWLGEWISIIFMRTRYRTKMQVSLFNYHFRFFQRETRSFFFLNISLLN